MKSTLENPGWHPFEGFCDLDDFPNAPVPALFSTLYRPLLELDRKGWHTPERAESGNFPVKRGLVGKIVTIRRGTAWK